MCGSHFSLQICEVFPECQFLLSRFSTAVGGCAPCYLRSESFCCSLTSLSARKSKILSTAASPDNLRSGPPLNRKMQADRNLPLMPPPRATTIKTTRKVHGMDCAGAPLGHFEEAVCWRSVESPAIRIHIISVA